MSRSSRQGGEFGCQLCSGNQKPKELAFVESHPLQRAQRMGHPALFSQKQQRARSRTKSTATDRSVRPTFSLHSLSLHIFFLSTFSLLIFSARVRARARGSPRVSGRGRGGLGSGGCIRVCFRNSLAILGRGRRILPARRGRSNLRARLRFGLMIL